MTRWVGLVRNVMLGREGLSRDVLLDAVRSAGGVGPRSYLTTGNVTFDAPDDELGGVAERFEDAVGAVLGRAEMVAVRSVGWLLDLVAVDRFAGYPGSAWATEVAFLRHDAPPVTGSGLGDPRRTVLVDVLDREVLTARPASGGARPHVNRLVEQATGRPATTRGWGTLQRIAAAPGE